MADLNIYELAAIASKADASDNDDYYESALWVEIDNPDGSWDLYTVNGFKPSCAATLSLTYVEHCTPDN